MSFFPCFPVTDLCGRCLDFCICLMMMAMTLWPVEWMDGYQIWTSRGHSVAIVRSELPWMANAVSAPVFWVSKHARGSGRLLAHCTDSDKWDCPCGRLIASSSSSSSLLAPPIYWHCQVQIHQGLDWSLFLLVQIRLLLLLRALRMCSGASVGAHCISFWWKSNKVVNLRAICKENIFVCPLELTWGSLAKQAFLCVDWNLLAVLPTFSWVYKFQNIQGAEVYYLVVRNDFAGWTIYLWINTSLIPASCILFIITATCIVLILILLL